MHERLMALDKGGYLGRVLVGGFEVVVDGFKNLKANLTRLVNCVEKFNPNFNTFIKRVSRIDQLMIDYNFNCIEYCKFYVRNILSNTINILI